MNIFSRNGLLGSAFLTAALAAAPAAQANDYTVCIDPGHGGTDPGAMCNKSFGCTIHSLAVNGNLEEADVVLDIGNKLKTMLENAGFKAVYMTRSSDATVSLSSRSSYANSKGCTRFVSIHDNSSGTANTATGVETYCYSGTSLTSNSCVQAQNIQTEVLKVWPITNRGRKQANFHVIRETNMPATLTELGFINNCNPDVNSYLSVDSKRTDAARAHLYALQTSLGLSQGGEGSVGNGNNGGSSGGSTGGGSTGGGSSGGGSNSSTKGTARGVLFKDVGAGTNDMTNRIAGGTVSASGASVTTDSNGNWSFSLSPGTYTLSGSASGYNKGTKSCKVTAGSTSWCSFGLTVASSGGGSSGGSTGGGSSGGGSTGGGSSGGGTTPTVTTGTLKGTLKDASSGAKIGGATIVTSSGERTTTSSTGAYSFTLPAGAYSITGSASGYNGNSASCSSLSAGGTVTCNLTLEKAVTTGTIQGTLTDASTGMAIIGATVSGGGASATTSSSGAFSMNLGEGTHTLTGSASGYDTGSATCSYLSAGGTVNCDFSLSKTITTGNLRGAVVNADSGVAIANATVKASNGKSVTTTSVGGYSFTLEAGDYSVTVSAQGYETATKSCPTVKANGTSTCNVSLVESTGFIAGKLTNAANGAPIGGATVRTNDGRSSTTSADGSFKLKVPEGLYTLTSEAVGYARVTETCPEVRVGATVDCSASLTKYATSGTIKGVVKDAGTGSTIVGASIKTNNGLSTMSSSSGYSFTTYAGNYSVTARANGYEAATVNCPALSDGATVTCNVTLQKASSGGTLQGTVFRLGNTGSLVSPATVTLDTGASVIYEGKGDWKFTGLGSGTYTVTVSATGYYTTTYECPVAVTAGGKARCNVEMPRIYEEEKIVVSDYGDSAFIDYSGTGGADVTVLQGETNDPESCEASAAGNGSGATGFGLLLLSIGAFLVRRRPGLSGGLIAAAIATTGLTACNSGDDCQNEACNGTKGAVAIEAPASSAKVMAVSEKPGDGLVGPAILEGTGNVAAIQLQDAKVATKAFVKVKGKVETVVDGDDWTAPAFSPDGESLVFTKSKMKGLYLRELSPVAEGRKARVKGGITTLSEDDGAGYAPRFSKDGKSIAFRAPGQPFHAAPIRLVDRQGREAASFRMTDNVWVWATNDDSIVLRQGKKETVISQSAMDKFYRPFITPDGRWVIYNGLNTGVYGYRIADGKTVFFGAGEYASTTEDGRFLTFAETTDDGQEFTGGVLRVADLMDEDATVCTVPVEGEIVLHPSVSLKRSSLVFSDAQGRIRMTELEFAK